MPLLEASFDRGGVFLGVLEGPRLVGAAVIDTRRLGRRQPDLVQLSFLHVGRDHRRLGFGTERFEAAHAVAAEFGGFGPVRVGDAVREHGRLLSASRLPGTPDADPELLALEPEDIHFECRRRARSHT
jgi:hypothetical protein